MTTISVRVDDSVKATADSYLKAMGLSMSSYLTMSLKALNRKKDLPFTTEISDPFDYSREEYFDKIEKGLKDYKAGKFKHHDLVRV